LDTVPLSHSLAVWGMMVRYEPRARTGGEMPGKMTNRLSPVPRSSLGVLATLVWAAAAILGLVMACEAHAVGRFAIVQERGYLNCGLAGNAPGFSEMDRRGVWRGLDVEFCAGLAAAIFGKKDAVKFFSIAPSDSFKALADGDIDVLMGTTAWTLSRDTEFGARFVGVLYYDGGGFMAPRNHSISSVLELSGASVCVLGGSAGQRAVTDYFDQRKMRYQLVISERWDQIANVYAEGGCTVLFGDQSALAYERTRLPRPADHTLLAEQISKQPLGPAVKSGDERWFAIVRWVLMSMIAAEELGVTRSNVSSMASSTVLDVHRLLGREADLGAPLGLARDWAFQVIAQIGNYGEIFDRTIGLNSPLKLERGLNALWNNGGLMYAAPLR